MKYHVWACVCKQPDGPLGNRPPRRRNAQQVSRALAFEPLEHRRLLAVDAAVVSGQAPLAAASDLVSANSSPAVEFQLTHLFTGVANAGTFPDAGLTLVGSTFYGTTEGGGLDDSGTVFSINTDGSNYQVLHTFTGSATDGAFPYAGLTVIGSTLYGTTHNAGSASDGVIFSITTTGTNFKLLHSFTGGATDGAFPYSGLTAVGTTLYGTTNNGGTANDGTIFSISSTGTSFQLLHSFTETTSDGAFPYAGLTTIGSTLYGTTNNGGTADDGTLFSITTTGTNFQVLHSFTGTTTDGAVPDAVLTVIGSTFYGTTDEGGTANKGTVFAIGTGGTGFQVIHSFTEATTDGAYPRAGVIASGSTLYGTTINGGTADDGTVYSLNTGGTSFQVLHSFAGTSDGAASLRWPGASPVRPFTARPTVARAVQTTAPYSRSAPLVRGSRCCTPSLPAPMTGLTPIRA